MGEIPETGRGEWARVAARRRALAQLLSVATQQLVGLDRPGEVGGQVWRHGVGRRAIRPLVVVALHPEAEPDQYAQRVRVGRERAVRAAEEQDLVRSRLADPGESLEQLFRLARRPRDEAAQ